MSDLTRPEAARLLRLAAEGGFAASDFDSAWPDDVSDDVDLVSAHAAALDLYEARRLGDASLIAISSDGLREIADALDAGRPLDWVEANPPWARSATFVAVAIGLIGWVVGIFWDWPRWTKFLPLLAALCTVWVFEYLWQVRRAQKAPAS